MILIYYPITFIIALISTWGFIHYAKHKGLIDTPNQRSSHTIPTPRGGGLVFISLWILYWLIAYSQQFTSFQHLSMFLPATLIISVISYIDDHRHIAARIRFLCQAIAALVALYAMGSLTQMNLGVFTLNSPWLIMPFAFLFILWSINLFNFMDGMDGFAGVEAVLVLGIGSLLIFEHGGSALAHALWVLVVLLLAFLCWNKPKAKLFMGDVGSATLGLIIAISGLVAQKFYHVPLLLWLMLYGVFLFDATATLVRRILRKEKWYDAHKSHAYQRLHQAGWSHGKVLLGLICVNVFISGLVLVADYFPQTMLYCAIGEFIGLLALYVWVEKKQPM